MSEKPGISGIVGTERRVGVLGMQNRRADQFDDWAA